MSRQKRDYKLFCYIEEQFYLRVVEVANQQDQSVSDYIRDLLIEDLYRKKLLTTPDFVSVVHNSSNSRLNPSSAEYIEVA